MEFAEQASLCFEREKKAYIAGLGRDQLEHLASPMTKSESKYQRVQDKSETIEKRLESGLESETGLEYYSPNLCYFEFISISQFQLTQVVKLLSKLMCLFIFVFILSKYCVKVHSHFISHWPLSFEISAYISACY